MTNDSQKSTQKYASGGGVNKLYTLSKNNVNRLYFSGNFVKIFLKNA